MGQGGSPASNLVCDLVSIQFHALKGAQVYGSGIGTDAYPSDAMQTTKVEPAPPSSATKIVF